MTQHQIAKCSGGGCPQKTQCYRFTTQTPQEMMFAYPPLNPSTLQCDYYASSLQHLLLEAKKKGTENGSNPIRPNKS